MNNHEPTRSQSCEGVILVVDDDPATLRNHSGILAKHFEVLTAASGTAALALCESRVPDLVFLDCEMPGLNGFETCVRLRAMGRMPIIFVTAHNSPEMHMKAYDVGGSDLCVKPVPAEILIRKARLAISVHREREQLRAEQSSIQEVAKSFMSSMGDSGILLNFVRASQRCASLADLAKNSIAAAIDYGAECCVHLHDGYQSYDLSHHGVPTELERSVLRQLSIMGRQFQFSKRLVVNYDHVSLLVNNMPDVHTEQAGRLRDNITALAESTEMLALSIRAKNVDNTPNPDFVKHLLDLQKQYRVQFAEISLRVLKMTDAAESLFTWVATSEQQERQIVETLQASTEHVCAALKESQAIRDIYAKFSIDCPD